MATSAAPSSLDDKSNTAAEEMSCGFCLQKLIYMEDPRILPCNHVFCLPCLQGDFARSNIVQCGFCSKNHGKLDIDKLPTVKAELSVNQIAETIRSGILSCDVCTENPSPTDKYCRDCGVKLCVEHYQTHEMMLKGSHEILSLEKFKRMRGRDLRRETCHEHMRQNLRLACERCQQIFCQYCDMRTNCRKTNMEDTREPKVPRIPHEIQSLDTLAEEYRNKMGLMLKSLSEKISGTGQTEKQCWKVFDDVEDKVKLTLAELDRVTSEQIGRVKRRSEELQREIEDYLTESTEMIEKHISDLVEQREKLDSTWSALINKLNHYSDTEFLRSYQTAMDDLKATEEIEVSVFKPVEIELSTSLGHGEPLGFTIKRHKPQLTLIGPTHTLKTDCYSVCWKEDGTLISCGNDNITLFSQEKQKADSTYIDVGDCIREYRDGYLVIAGATAGLGTLERYSADLKKKATLTDSTHMVVNHISVSDTVIVAVEGLYKQLAVYNAKTLKHEYKIKIDGSVDDPDDDCRELRGVCIYNKDTVLVSENTFGKVHLYELKMDGKLLWTCDLGIESPNGICVDDEGYIYVACDAKVIVINKDGKILQMLSHDVLDYSSLYDISTRGDKLALAVDEQIHIFDIQR